MIAFLKQYLYHLAQFKLLDPNSVNLPNKLDSGTSLATKVQGVFQVLSMIMGAIAVLVIAIAGFQYILSGGDPNKTARAKDAILYALIGLAIAAFSYTIVTFVITRIF